MAGKLEFTLKEYQDAATKWRPDLLMLPIIGCQETLQYMTARPGIRYKEQVGAISGDAQFGPYDPSRSTDFNLKVDFRTLETYFGSVVARSATKETLALARTSSLTALSRRFSARWVPQKVMVR